MTEQNINEEEKINWNPRGAFKGHELIESFLDVKGMTQTELAHKLKLSTAKINDIIKGRRNINPKTAKKLAKVFGVEHTVFL